MEISGAVLIYKFLKWYKYIESLGDFFLER